MRQLYFVSQSYSLGAQFAAVDFTALDADDFTSGGAREVAATGDVDAIEITPWNAGNATTLGPDGSNGFVVDPNGTQQQTPTTDNAPGFAWDPSSIAAAQNSKVVGMAVQIEASPSRPTNTSHCLSCIPTPGANPTAVQSRFDQGDNYNVRQFFGGGSDDLATTSPLASMPRRQAIIRNGDSVVAYYSLTAADMSAADFESMAAGTAPSGWVRITGTYGPWVSLQSAARCDTEIFAPSRDNSDMLVAAVSTNSTGDGIYEKGWFYWTDVVAS